MNFYSKSSENKTFSKKVFIVYSILMLISYYSYVLLDYYRLNKSQYWLSKDLDAITQLNRWVFIFEALHSILFVVAVLTIHILFRKNIKVLTHFLLLNIALFVGMALVNFIISLATSLPSSNLIKPLISMIIVFSIDVLLVQMKDKAGFYT
ncbi:hypothetical protein MUG84_03370 [Paenibacillus sp. KQZ6P-2]|uniref:Uncharacterized protein n=1 Tax=Paenibacillus mangrovi TaxID=2931978 RepID=A0A9X2B0S3_9BACL|nr:hypothetical protein [Paenibacillus mangrovi]MCJ8010784.1 hypothetical protein [Paenibacillus mangrovi]